MVVIEVYKPLSQLSPFFLKFLRLLPDGLEMNGSQPLSNTFNLLLNLIQRGVIIIFCFSLSRS